MLKIGDRVNVTKLMLEDWHSESWLKNACIVAIWENRAHIRADEFTTRSEFGFLNGGILYFSAYKIENI